MTETTGETTAVSAPQPGTTRVGVVIGVLVVAAFVMILNETIVVVALKTLSGVFEVSASTVQWLTSGFLLALGVAIPTTGYLLQRFTPRQIFIAATSLFSLGTLICGLAPGFEVLLVGRVVQACGTALAIPLLMTTVMILVPPERRGSMMGTLTIVIAVAPALGPTIGGFILTHFGWRWMFFAVLPLSVIVLLVGLVLLRLPTETRKTPLDLLSVLLSALAFGGIVYGFAAIGEGSGHGVPPWVPLVVGAVMLVVFVTRQIRLQRTDRALLDMRPFANSQFSIAAGLGALVFMSLLGAGAILLPLFLQTVLHVSADTTGLAVLPGGLVLALLGRPVGTLFDRYGPRPLVVPGAIALAVAMWLFAFLGSGPLIAVIGAHVLLMAGLGLMMTPLLTGSLGVLPPHLYSHGSAIMTTLQQVAGAASTAGLVTVATVFSAAPTGSPDPTGLRTAFMVAGCIGILAFVLSWFMRRPPAPPTTEVGDASGAGERATRADSAAAAGPATPDGAADMPVVPAVAGSTAPAEMPVAPTTGAHLSSARATGANDQGPDRAHAAGPANAADSAGSASPEDASGATPALALRGRVDTADSVHATVTLIDTNGRQRGHARTVDGQYEIAVPGAGTWYVVVSAPGRQPRADRLSVVEHDERRELRHDVSLGPATAGRADPHTAPTGVRPSLSQS